MAITTYTPQLKVTLIKLVARRNGVSERYAEAARELDLTPYLGDAGTVQTVKDLNAPGTFTVSFADWARGRLDSVHALVEPMDMVEIRAARMPTAGPPPLIMRGFVGSVKRSETIDEKGTPKRTVSIAGHDAGKLLQMHQLFLEFASRAEQEFLKTFMSEARSGMAVPVKRIGDFMSEMVEKVVNPRTEKLFAVNSNVMRNFVLQSSVTMGSVAHSMREMLKQTVPGEQKPINASVWQMMKGLADHPWNELFVEDAEEGPVIRFRPVPYKNLEGAFIMPGAVDPGNVFLTPADIVDWSVERSDSRVANWYWIPTRDYALETNGLVNQQSVKSDKHLDFDHPNSHESLYGAKKMEAVSRLMPDIGEIPANAPPAERKKLAGHYIEWIRMRAEQLKMMNRDNGVFEEGTAKLIGSEVLKAGRYIRLTRGKVMSEAYITKVTHDFTPKRTWVTTVKLDRCTGFLERSKLSANPSWMEGIGGPYS